MSSFVEECWFVYGIKVLGRFFGFKVYHSSGTPGSVEFKWERALLKYMVGWVHTHPPGFNYVSGTDDKTMKGWSIALGKPLLCAVSCDGGVKAWQYWKETKSRNSSVVCRKEISIKVKGPFITASTLGDTEVDRV